MQKTEEFKAGDTFILTCNYAIGKNPEPLPPGIRSQIRTPDGVLVAELALNVISQDDGVFTLRTDTTQTWFDISDTMFCDVQFTDADGVVFSTNTYEVPVIQDVTHD